VRVGRNTHSYDGFDWIGFRKMGPWTSLLSPRYFYWASPLTPLKEPSHHDVLASVRLAFSDFLGNVGKRP